MFLKDLHLNESNPRQIKGEKFEKLKKSIKEFERMLEIRPIIIDDDNVILGGNMRYRALEALGYTEIPDAWVKRASGLTDEQKREFLIKDNIGYGEWDFDVLFNEWDTELLKDWGMDLPDMDVNFGTNTDVEEDDFDVDSEQVETRCKRGDVWQLGKHRLMCGDSTTTEDVERLMNGAKADMLFTDPPYGYEYKSNFREKTPKFKVLKNDDKILDFLHTAKAYNNGFVFICTSWKVLSKWLPVFEKEHELTNMIIWDKGGGGLGSLKDTFLTDYEVILVSHNNSEITGKRLGSVWEIGKDNVNTYAHPTQKPIALSATAIENTTHRGESVLDLFGGSGSTLIACEQLNRACRMMELDEHYCDVIMARWEKLTGQTAVRIEAGMSTD